MTDYSERDAHDKAIETLRARAALRGYALHLIDAGGERAELLICRWNLSRTLPDVAAVEAFLAQAGATMEGT
jgi:hypothetical protein